MTKKHKIGIIFKNAYLEVECNSFIYAKDKITCVDGEITDQTFYKADYIVNFTITNGKILEFAEDVRRVKVLN